MKRILSLTALVLLALSLATESRAQAYAVRTNAVGWGLMAANVGMDIVLGDQNTLSASVYKTMGRTYVKDANITAVQLSWHHWYAHQPFVGMFWGMTVAPAVYDLRIDATAADGTLRPVGHDGTAIPMTLDVGYSIPLSRRFNLELAAGVGAVWFTEHLHYDAGPRRRHDVRFAPANLGASLVWMLK